MVERARAVAFTIWSVQDEMQDDILMDIFSDTRSLPELPEGTTYGALSMEWGGEDGEEENEWHIHGVLVYKNPRIMSVHNMRFLVASWLPWIHSSVHYEPVHNLAQYLRYMEKDGCVRSVGRHPTQGERTDFRQFFERIAQEEEPDELSIALRDPSTWARSHNAVRRLIQLKSAHKNRHKIRENLDVSWIYGRSGSGKTSAAIQAFEDHGLRWCIGSVGDPPWFDFLTGSEDAWIWDEFDGSAKLGLVLRVLDKFPIQVPVKGGFTDFSVTHITVTSNLPPWKMYSPEELARHDNGRALKRRIKTIYKMGRDYAMREVNWATEN